MFIVIVLCSAFMLSCDGFAFDTNGNMLQHFVPLNSGAVLSKQGLR